MKVCAIVPIKLKSERLKNKNFLLLNKKPLLVNIFRTLTMVKEIDNIYCYSSDDSMMHLLPRNIIHMQRPKSLDKNSVKANELFRYGVKQLNTDIVIICHATSPFIKPSSITNGIKSLQSGKFRSSFSVKELSKYSWYKNKALNYDPEKMRRTQDLEPIYYETSGFYAFFRSDYLKSNTRINKKIKFVEVSEKEAIDIDHYEDLVIARALNKIK